MPFFSLVYTWEALGKERRNVYPSSASRLVLLGPLIPTKIGKDRMHRNPLLLFYTSKKYVINKMRWYLKKEVIITFAREWERRSGRLRNQAPQERFLPFLSRQHAQVEWQPRDWTGKTTFPIHTYKNYIDQESQAVFTKLKKYTYL